MKVRYNLRHKGLTLIELLLLMVVISILFRVSELAAIEMSATAEAQRIITNLTMVRNAAMCYYDDHKREINAKWAEGWKNGTANTFVVQNLNLNDALGIGEYLTNNLEMKLNSGKDRDNSIPTGGYGVHDVKYRRKKTNIDVRQTWYVGYKFNDGEDAVKAKIKSRAKAYGLHFSEKCPETNIGQKDNIVWMKVFGDWSPSNTNP